MRTGSDWHNKQNNFSLDGGQLEPPGQPAPRRFAFRFKKKRPQRTARDHRAFIVVREEIWDYLQVVQAAGAPGSGGSNLCTGRTVWAGEIMWLPVMSKVTLMKAFVIEVFVFLHSGKGKFRNSVPTLRCCWLDASQTCAPTWALWWSFPTIDRRPSLTTRYADIKPSDIRWMRINRG